MKYSNAAIAADAGIVNTQVVMMFPAMPQRTAENLRVVPTPMMAPAMVCVVLTGIPMAVAEKRVTAPAVSALNPPIGLRWVSFMPIVFTIFMPPARVPNDMTDRANTSTHNGICRSL